MQIGTTNKLEFSLIKIIGLLFFLFLSNTLVYADTEINRSDDLCAPRGFDCLLISGHQGQDVLDKLSFFLKNLNDPLVNSNLTEICETNLQITKKLTPSNTFKEAEQAHLGSTVGSSELSLVEAQSSPFLGCKVAVSNMYATSGILICALVGFVIFSNRRRV